MCDTRKDELLVCLLFFLQHLNLQMKANTEGNKKKHCSDLKQDPLQSLIRRSRLVLIRMPPPPRNW